MPWHQITRMLLTENDLIIRPHNDDLHDSSIYNTTQWILFVYLFIYLFIYSFIHLFIYFISFWEGVGVYLETNGI